IEALKEYLNEFKVRIVLTAHPTQFYPGSVLGIINDLTEAVKESDMERIKDLLAQLGKTPFFKHKKPTPYDEAVNLIWYLEHVFYDSFGSVFDYIQQNIYDNKTIQNEIINIGFWPGGDRDGNPFVLPDTTLKVASLLKETLLKKYVLDLKKLKRKLTFTGVEDRLIALLSTLNKQRVKPDSFDFDFFVSELKAIKKTVVKEHHGLYINDITSLINKTQLFGYHFASLDVRQDSRIHHTVFSRIVESCIEKNNGIFPNNYNQLNEEAQIDVISKLDSELDISIFKDELVYNTLKTIQVVKSIQSKNGELGANRYIISNNQTALNVMQLYAMLKLVAFNDKLSIDIVPLFETVNDLENAPKVMAQLYRNKAYKAHLRSRGQKQTIMLGFSDGTKDGGYFMANWAIFKAKEALTSVSKQHNIDVVFFDGRGGPPARGGGKTHQFYASLGPTIQDKEVQLTIQGQTISSNFGTPDSSKYNLEQLISSGLSNKLQSEVNKDFSEADRKTMDALASLSYQAYQDFKGHPKFIPYLERISTLKYYGKANIGSRPSKRSGSEALIFSDLRAIPFVGSWSQLKQNVPGFFGVGTAIQAYESRGELNKVTALYNNSSFFKTLLENSMMSLSKSFFPLTKYMAEDEEFGEFWTLIYKEYKLTLALLLKITGYKALMENEPSGKASIDVRESIVLPLLTIQQYALRKLQALHKQKTNGREHIEVFEKIVTRTLYGIINASRNSA
ncbi:MAG: phosphoenolpyruvate carboxylase, partial [Bacteroidota bacterium]|nr:phosphoenolpyruvate carboxylase [Bacteroidota bacterium]